MRKVKVNFLNKKKRNKIKRLARRRTFDHPERVSVRIKELRKKIYIYFF